MHVCLSVHLPAFEVYTVPLPTPIKDEGKPQVPLLLFVMESLLKSIQDNMDLFSFGHKTESESRQAQLLGNSLNVKKSRVLS